MLVRLLLAQGMMDSAGGPEKESTPLPEVRVDMVIVQGAAVG